VGTDFVLVSFIVSPFLVVPGRVADRACWYFDLAEARLVLQLSGANIIQINNFLFFVLPFAVGGYGKIVEWLMPWWNFSVYESGAAEENKVAVAKVMVGLSCWGCFEF
jgi:hypothetical protein